jgi:ABC-type transport system involved in multi-copper enzyme maturation permease subunit
MGATELNATAETTAVRTEVSLPEPRPSFRGSVRGEVLKLSRQRWIWGMLGLAVLFYLVVNSAFFEASNFKQSLERNPSQFVFSLYDIYLTLFDTGSGIFLLLVSARLVGMEYSAGTIRVLLARGAGRLRLLLAKLTALGLLGLILLAGFMVLTVAAVYLVVVGWEGSLSRISSLPAHLWTDLEVVVLVALVSVVMSILIGVAAAVVGRSVAFGIGAALVFYPVDNFLTIILRLLNALTGWHFLLDISGYLLGPTLNHLPALLETDHIPRAAFVTPLVTVDANHAWLVIGAWALVLVGVSVGLTWRRDVP